jgi:hypothetical protein
MNKIATQLCCFLAFVTLEDSCLSQAKATTLTANFDSLNEGVQGVSFVDGGITFLEKKDSPGGPSITFAVEDASGDAWFTPLGSPFTSPNVLSFGGYSPGPGAGISYGHSFAMNPGELANSISLDGFFLKSATGTASLATLELLRDGLVVADSSLDLTSFVSNIEIHTLSINGVLFDKARIFGSGGTDGNVGRFGAAFDNVQISLVPEPSSIVLIGLAVCGIGAVSLRRQPG